MSVPLRLAATVELVSLVVLLANLATVHLDGVAALVGPVHGCAYLVAVALTVARAGWRSRAAALSVVPAVGGWAAAVALERAAGAAG
ncbi:DUF3817 domain-containing protein [Actinomycetospora straminea]|uniref:DUF3817 domain-containing protein n=1 Tax=Actinomycetospora straminea TaxID=663607 RepID=UPI002366BF68|nr:DUF3817 domain-containing protein [Actinomycetospora straminea]MDD7931838.1 DUF3817 domain-containing protein [Actinomycetospora straminea]